MPSCRLVNPEGRLPLANASRGNVLAGILSRFGLSDVLVQAQFSKRDPLGKASLGPLSRKFHRAGIPKPYRTAH